MAKHINIPSLIHNSHQSQSIHDPPTSGWDTQSRRSVCESRRQNKEDKKTEKNTKTNRSAQHYTTHTIVVTFDTLDISLERF